MHSGSFHIVLYPEITHTVQFAVLVGWLWLVKRGDVKLYLVILSLHICFVLNNHIRA